MKINNVILTCKLFDADAQYFMIPILESTQVKSLILFRNSSAFSENELWKQKGFGYYDSSKLKFVKRVIRMTIQRKVDVFIGIYEIPHGLIAIIASFLRRKPVVISIIGNPKYKIRNTGIRGFVTNWIYKKSDVITVTGSVSRDYLIQTKRIKADKIIVLPNSVPIDEFVSVDDSVKEYDLVTIGRLSPEKGLLNLIDIINIIKEKKPDIKLGIAGKGPEFDILQDKIKEIGLNENIDLLGYVESASEFLKKGKVFITTSFTEGLPRTAIQSMLAGLPVVASNVGDMSDIVMNNKTGVLIDNPHNLKAFAERVVFLLKDAKMLEELGKNAILHASKYYSYYAATKVWGDIFKYLETK